MVVNNARKASKRFGKSMLDFTGHKDYVLSVAILHAVCFGWFCHFIDVVVNMYINVVEITW